MHRTCRKMQEHNSQEGGEARWYLNRSASFQELKVHVASFMGCSAHGSRSCTCGGSPPANVGLYREGRIHACLTRVGDVCMARQGGLPGWDHSMLQLRFMQARGRESVGRTLQPLTSKEKSQVVEELLEDCAALGGAGVYLDSRNFGIRWHIRFKLAIMDGGGHVVSILVSSSKFHGLCVSICRHLCTPEGIERCFQCMPRALVPCAVLAR